MLSSTYWPYEISDEIIWFYRFFLIKNELNFGNFPANKMRVILNFEENV